MGEQKYLKKKIQGGQELSHLFKNPAQIILEEFVFFISNIKFFIGERERRGFHKSLLDRKKKISSMEQSKKRRRAMNNKNKRIRPGYFR